MPHSVVLSRFLSFFPSLTGMWLSLSLLLLFLNSCFVDVIPHFPITQAKNRHPNDNKEPAKQSDKKTCIIVTGPG